MGAVLLPPVVVSIILPALLPARVLVLVFFVFLVVLVFFLGGEGSVMFDGRNKSEEESERWNF